MKKTFHDNSHVTVALTIKEYEFFKEWMDEQMKIRKEKSKEALIERATELKNKAKELYPNEEFEVYVSNGVVNFSIIESDRFWRNAKTADVLIKVRKALDKDSNSTEERIYIK